MLFARFAAKAHKSRAVMAVIRWLYGAVVPSGFRTFAARPGARGVPRLRARPKGSALWNPAAFEKAGETFFCASRASL